MAVIKTYTVTDVNSSHLWDGEQPEMTVKQAIRIIKSRREKGVEGIDYIGERYVLDVDLTRVMCEHCQANLKAGAERR